MAEDRESGDILDEPQGDPGCQNGAADEEPSLGATGHMDQRKG